MKAVVVDHNVPGHLRLQDVDLPQALPSQAIVRVVTTSLNRGEVNGATRAETGARPGWDVAGVVEQAAMDSSGPKVGTRVVGFLRTGAWAEQVAVPTDALAALPNNVTFAQAATLPIAALTALYGWDRCGNLAGKRVLVTGASGGAGDFGVQIARLSGAYVVAQVRNAARADWSKESGAHQVVVGEHAAEAEQFGPYDGVFDGVGGQTLGNVLGMLAPGGVCIAYGATAGQSITFDLRKFFPADGVSLYGFLIFHEVTRHPAAGGLARLVNLVAETSLKPRIEVESPWTEIGQVAQRFLNREFVGKVVLHLQS